MLLLKTNPELKKVFGTLIKTMKVSVTWTDTFVVMNNSLILAGDVRSLIFNFDNKKAYTNIVEIPPESARLESMPSDALLNNVMNMVLYAFGKWGLISGLKVEKEYAALNALFASVLHPVNIEPGFGEDNFRFFKEGIQITYEDTILAILRLLKNEGKLKEGQSLATSERGENDGKPSADGAPKKEVSEQKGIDETEEDDYKIGLWHNLCWKKGSYDFQKSPQTDTAKSRIGNDFYISNYLCPSCGEKLYLGVYPTNKELLIETDEGRVFMARAYACHECNAFYTPQPDKLIQEGDVYSLQFDEDRTAYEDYLEILGSKAARTTNYKFNEFEAVRNRRKAEAEDTDRADADAESAGDAQAKGKSDRTTGIRGIKEQLLKSGGKLLSKNRRKQSEEARHEAQDKVPNETIHELQYEPLNDIDPIERAHKEPVQTAFPPRGNLGQLKTPQQKASANKEQPPAISAQDMTRLSQKTTEELKSILASLEHQNETAQSKSGPDAANSGYLEAVRTTLREKLTAKYDARMGALGNLSPKQLSDLKKQIEKETTLPDEKREEYRKKIDSRLYQAEESSLNQKVELGKNKTYAEIEQMIADVENQDIPDELKQESLKKLKRMKAIRAEREVEHLLTHMPLHLDRKQLSVYLDKIDQYQEVDLTPYRAQIEQRRDMAEKEEISAMIKRGGRKDRNALWSLYEQLQKQDFSEKNKAPFLEKIYEKIRRMDEDKLEEICPSIVTLSFADGLKAYEQISQGMFLPELKTNTLEMIQRRLTKLKTDESVQLMRKLKRDIEEKIPDYEDLYFYDAREEQKRAQNPQRQSSMQTDEEENNRESDGRGGEDNHAAMMCAVNGYASARGAYEYPLMVCDTSRSKNGKEGFVLTPDHIFYHTFLNSGVIPIPDIRKVEEGKKIFGKGIYSKSLGGKKTKLPSNIKPNSRNAFSEILDDFVHYLQEKPESRSLAYMAAEKHDVIRCYRCGFAYKGGNVCPKCGSKMNR